MKEYFAFQWHITDECDQRCKHCYIFSENNCKHLDAMTWEQMQETFYNCMDFCKVHGRLPYFYITGGDPILHPDFWRLLALLKEHDIPFAILGNPFHLTDEVCMRLKGYGCRKYQLSLDGLRETHDGIRQQPGSYDATMAAIPLLRSAGIDVRGTLYDTMIVHYLLDPESRHGMDHLARICLNYSPVPIEELIGKGARQITMDRVPVERCARYAAEDADVTLRLKRHLWPRLEEAGLTELYLRIEEPLIRVLADIEMAGVRIDSEALAVYAVELNRKLAELEAAIRTEAGEPNLNINSARQLGEVLFGKMRIAEKPKMTKTKQFCTDEDYLQSFARKHRIVDLILEYRGVKKLLSTYVEALPQLVNRSTGRIHTSFNQAVTATGRLSSTNPNLQNIPVRDDMGRRIRKAFIPSDDDHLLLSADYSQVELRLMAHLSGDESLIAAFEHGEDIHAATAAKLFNKTLDEVTSEERRRAKTANFGIIYGISAFGLSQRLEIPRKEAKEIIDGYFASYPGVKKYMDNVVEKAKEEGFVSTIFGRRRYLNDIASHNAIARGLAERNAVNAPIQGSAADIMKIAMINVHRRFAAEGIRSRVILQVHDELVVDMLRSEQERVTAIVTECMESAAQLKVRLIADAGVGGNWLEAH